MKYFKIFNKENIIITTLTFYIFFWDMFLTLGIKFDIRLVLFIISFFLIKEIINDLKKKNYNFIYLNVLIFLYLIIHSFIVGNLLNLKFFLSICFLLYIFGIAYYYSQIIIKNKKKIIFIFINLFLISIVLHYFIGFSTNPEPFSCGGLKNFFGEKNNFDKPLFLIHFLSSYSLIFNENSHLAMSCVAVIIYSIYLFSERKQKKISLFIIVIFLFITFLKSSATLLAGTIFSIIAIFLFEYKRLNKYFIYSLIFLLVILSSVFATDRVCINKLTLDANNKKILEDFNPLSKRNLIENIIKDINQVIISNKEIDPDKIKDLNEKLNKFIQDKTLSDEIINELIILKKIFNKYIETGKFDEKNLEVQEKLKNIKDRIVIKRTNDLEVRGTYIGSLSSEVFFHALKVTYQSILKKPFGWGFQGYELAFNNYNKNNKIMKKSLEKYNNKDASNNTFKILTEFGIFSLILFSVLFYIFLSKKISIENKIFLFPFLITQFIRGAGYFNGAFILILFLVIVLQFKNFKVQNN